MFRESLNQVTLTFTLSPTGPVLVKSGREAGADPTLVDMNFVRTRRPGFEQPTVFIPGSSLKGTLRSHTERVLRTVLGEGPDKCCNPFDDTSFCGKRLEKEKNTATRYRESCPACRIFGNTVLGGRLSVTDAYPPDGVLAETNATEQRDGVAIDRILGSVAQGPFTLEVVTRGAFRAMLTLENFELWQVGLLAVALRDLGTGLCPIGFGKTRGLGRMAVTLEYLDVAYPGRFDPEADGRHYATMLYPVGAFHPEWRGVGEESYGLADESPISLTDFSLQLRDDGSLGRVASRLEGDQAVRGALAKAAEAWKTFALTRREVGI
jgi:CRISPR-associated protein Csm3